MRKICPHCKKLLIDHTTHKDILLVGEQPGFEDIRSGVARFEGKIGDALRQELGRVGLAPGSYDTTYLWKHAPDEKDCDPDWHLDRLVKEFQGRKYILLMGSKLVTALIGKDGMYTGLLVKVPHVNATFVAAPSMISLFQGLGDWRLSLGIFASHIRKDQSKSTMLRKR